MITKVTGKVDGSDVIFAKESGGSWTVTVPFDLDGMYVVEVTATNEQGLTAYCTKMLLIVDPSTLSISIVPYDYFVSVVDSDYIVDVIYPKR